MMVELPQIGVRRAVVNGTREEDWSAVAALAAQFPWVHPSFGLHPWHVPKRTSEWRERLTEQVDAHPGCGICAGSVSVGVRANRAGPGNARRATFVPDQQATKERAPFKTGLGALMTATGSPASSG